MMEKNHILHLTYHNVVEGESPGANNCPPQRFRRQIEGLKASGYEFLTCGEVARRLRERETLPEKHVTLSFDDGLKHQYETAFPILQEYGVPATFFYITCALAEEMPPVIGFQVLIEHVGAQHMEQEILPEFLAGTSYGDLLNPKRFDISGRKMGAKEETRRIKWVFNHFLPRALQRELLGTLFERFFGAKGQKEFVDERFIPAHSLREMEGAGMEIASHTMTHPPLDIAALEEIEQELCGAQAQLAEILSAPPKTFAWTFGGNYRQAAREIAARYYDSAWNLHTALTAMPGGIYNDLTNIPRLDERVFLPEG